MKTLERVDLRVGGCFPYVQVGNQGSQQSCLAHSFSVALYCLKAKSGLPSFPISGLVKPSLSRIFSEAIDVSPDRTRGTSFESVVESALREHSQDLRYLGWKVVALPNSADICKQRLRMGVPVVAGYQVNSRIARFHSEAEVCEAHGYLLPPFRTNPVVKSAHAVLIIGFDDGIGCFMARNSWGVQWGVEGHFLIRYEDLEDSSFFTDLVSFARTEEAVKDRASRPNI